MKSRMIQISLAVFAISIGVYPIIYLLTDAKIGLLASKTDELLANTIWQIAFFTHISFGGISLLTGWSQFFTRWREKHLGFHRILGKVYVGCVTFSGLAGLYLAFHATGGRVASIGFGMLALSWLFTTWKAFLLIRSGYVEKHQQWMMRSYALTFAAVTLRLWLPFFTGIVGMEFIPAYRIIAWLCWVPNLLLIEWVIFRKRTNSVSSLSI